MNAADLLRITHPELVEQSIAVFDRIGAESARIGLELEAIQARAQARADALLASTSDEVSA
jgi:hypothetical protein